MAGTSHGTFYQYFSSKDDLLATLIAEALRDMDAVVAAFPTVVSGAAGQAALVSWVRRFGRTYAQHATAFQRLSSADADDRGLRRAGLRLLWQFADAITQGMSTAASSPYPGERAELTGLLCAMMLERMNYLISVGVAVDTQQLAERLAAIIMAAFAAPHRSGASSPARPRLAAGNPF
jgi:AcrR family transcriptional regulator